jgi:hypothetical protein
MRCTDLIALRRELESALKARKRYGGYTASASDIVDETLQFLNTGDALMTKFGSGSSALELMVWFGTRVACINGTTEEPRKRYTWIGLQVITLRLPSRERIGPLTRVHWLSINPGNLAINLVNFEREAPRTAWTVANWRQIGDHVALGAPFGVPDHSVELCCYWASFYQLPADSIIFLSRAALCFDYCVNYCAL